MTVVCAAHKSSIARDFASERVRGARNSNRQIPGNLRNPEAVEKCGSDGFAGLRYTEHCCSATGHMAFAAIAKYMSDAENRAIEEE
ncbi:hypothetical protein BD779DRAFT_1674835 [Infundibulicybe gibba]|nr:hypothetical protein BD779DRAFT_1674835 [Infundibulicybe gibba]